jgi:predicted O-methyltransferase YrrM
MAGGETQPDDLLNRTLQWGLEILKQPEPVVDGASLMRALDDFERLDSLLAAGAIVNPRNPDLGDRRNLIAPARHVVSHILDHARLTDPHVVSRLRRFLEVHRECVEEDGFVFSADWFSKKCIPRWSVMFEAMRGAPNLSFLEIGSFEGRSALWLLENVLTHASSRLTCVDTFPEPIGQRFNHNMRRAGFHSPIALAPPPGASVPWKLARSVDETMVKLGKRARLVTLAGTSRDVLRRLKGPFDFVYVDADHRPAAVLEDAVLAWPLVRVGGTMVFDDYSDSGTASGIDAFVGVFRHELTIVGTGAQLEITRVGSGEEGTSS